MLKSVGFFPIRDFLTPFQFYYHFTQTSNPRMSARILLGKK